MCQSVGQVSVLAVNSKAFPLDTRVMLVCGSKEWKDEAKVRAAMTNYFKDRPKDEKWIVVTGVSPNCVDPVAESVAKEWKFPVQRFQPDHHGVGKRAWVKCANAMVEASRPHVAFAFFQPNSTGTRSILSAVSRHAKKNGARLGPIFRDTGVQLVMH